MSFLLQIRRPHRAYETLATSGDLLGLSWGWRQCLDPRYFTGHVRIIDVSAGTQKLVMKAKVSL